MKYKLPTCYHNLTLHIKLNEYVTFEIYCMNGKKFETEFLRFKPVPGKQGAYPNQLQSSGQPSWY